MTGREFAAFILPRYGFRKDAADLVLSHCDFEILDEMDTHGGGLAYLGPGDHCRIVWNGTQHEAAVHEMAHVWWYLQRGRYIDELLRAFLVEADQPQAGPYRRVRELCHEYKYGNETWAGMWIPPVETYAGRWNHDEVFAGLASGTMGDLEKLPPSLRGIYARMFQEPFRTYFPLVME